MSDYARGDRPSPASVEVPETAAPTKVFRSLKPGEVGGDRMNPVHEERAVASAQIQRTLKAWRASNGAAAGESGVPQTTGSPLPSSIRKQMEPKLGADLGAVRVHTGGQSADAAKNFGARAFTVGEDVHFNAGEFRPGTKEGDKLLAHELTHVVQGQKSGIQRSPEKGEEAKGEEKGEKGAGAEVSKPDEPAEKEADAVGDKVGEDLHGGGEKGAKAKGGEAGEKGAGEEGDKGGGEKKPEEKPASIAAKLESVALKIFRAGPTNTPAQVKPGTVNQTHSTMSANTTSTAADPPTKFTKSVGKFDENFAKVVAAIQGKGGKPEDIAKVQGKKSEWFLNWGTATLSADADAAKAKFADIENDLKTMFPDDKPSAGGGSLYTGRTGGAPGATGPDTGRGRAEDHKKDGDAKKDGITYKTLETTLIGQMFDGVANDVNDPAEKPLWIPYRGSQAGAWWSKISASYAKAFTGEVSAFVNIGFPYMVDKFVKGKGWTKDQAKAGKAELAGVLVLDSSVFRDDELPRVADGMKEGRVTKLTVKLHMETSAGQFKDATITVDAHEAAGLLPKINAGIASNVTVDELFKNIT